MLKTLLCDRLSRWLGVAVLGLLATTGTQAQTTLLNETFEGTNSFTLVNGSATNAWAVGAAAGNGPTTAGSSAAYISPDGGTTYAYTISAISVVHMYRDVTFPAGQSVVQLSLDWKGLGESSATYDNLQLFLVPTTVTPTASSSGSLASNSRLQNSGYAPFATLTGSGTYGRATVQLPASVAGTTQRLVMQWYNDASGGSQPPAAFDNVLLTAAAAVPICGTRSVGPTGDYASLGAALTAVNLNGVCGPLVLELQSTYVSTGETFPLVYNYAGGSSTNTVTVRPAAGATGLSITGSSTASILNLNGGRFLVLDGRPGGSGPTVSGPATATDLTVANTNASGIGINLTGDATNNVVQHCQLRGVGTSTTFPTVNFGSAITAGNSNNTLQYNTLSSGATTAASFVYSSNSLNAANSIVNNNLADFYHASSTTYAVYLSSAGAGWTISNNSFYQTAARTPVASTHYAIYVASGGGHTVANNAIGGAAPATISTTGPATLAGTWTVSATAAAYRFVGIYVTGSSNATTVANNTIGNIAWYSSSGASTAPGVWAGVYALNNANVRNNTIGNGVTVTTTSTGGISYGIVSSTGPATLNVNGNTVAGLTAAGSAGTIAASVAGIQTAGTTNNIYQNKIYGLTAGNAGTASGILAFAGTTTTVYNNLVGNLAAPASTGLLAVLGLNVAGGTTVNAYYNTIYLNASSTGATFGSSGIYLGSTSATLDLRNNIVVNKSTANGTGGVSAALRRVSGTAGTAPANLAGTTNNNLYYAGVPSATNLIYVEGTTATQTNAQQTLAAYKAFLLGREGNSVTEDVPFISTTGTAATFLHVSPATATQVESGGTPVSGITTDYDGETRDASFPDIGADEGTFMPQDLTGPTLTFAPLSNTSSPANRTLAVTITDVSGISTTTPPRLFYRKGSMGTFTSALATGVSGSTYTFTFDFTAVGGVTNGDVIQYYVVAQDVPGNVGSSPAGNTFTTPALINSFTILNALSGTYYVGTSPAPAGTPASRVFATLTAAASAYGSSGMSGAVTFLLLDNAYSTTTGETFPIIFFNNVEASATNTLLVQPAPGVAPVVTAAGSVLALAGTRYVTIDGSNGGGTPAGTSRNLTLTNTALTANTYGLGLLTQTGLAPSNLFVAVRNVNVVGGGATANATFGLLLSGADNDNVTLQNNSIQGVTTGIQAFGSSSGSAGGLDNLVVTDNVVGPATAAAGANINQSGILVANALSPVISRNEVQNIVNPTATFSANMTGILLQDVRSAQVSRNAVHDLTYTGTSTAKVYGISTQLSTSGFNTAANPSANRFDNNLVYRLNSTATSASWNTSGINNNGGFGDQYYFNTVYLTGQLSNGSAGSAAFSNGNGITSTAATNIDVRNNIFSIVGGTGLAATPLYAHYTTLTTYAGSTLNNNDLFVTVGAAGLARIGRIGTTDATTLADWRTATGQEASSLSVDPQFVQTSAVPYDLTPANVALNNTGTPISGVTVDFTGATRGVLPDIGAYEFTPLSNDLAAEALLTPATGTACYGPAEAVSVRIRNAGTAALNFATTTATITVVVTLPGGTTQTLTTTLTTGTLASNATQVVTLPGTLNMTAAGTYSFSVVATVAGDGNTSNDDLSPVPTRTVTAPVAGTLAAGSSSLCGSGTTTLTLTGSANGTAQLQQSTDNVTFTDVSGATLPFTTPVLTSTTYYRAVVSCNANTVTGNVVTVTVNNPTVATTNSPQTICAGGTATLTATASPGANVRFFDAATGGTALTTTTAGSFTTPALTASTTYYAEAFTGNQENVGKPSTTGTDGTNLSGGLYFTTTGSTTIANVTVYRTANAAAGTATIHLIPGSSTTVANAIATITVPVPANTTAAVSPTVLTLNFVVPAAGQYTLHLSTATPALIRDSGTGPQPVTAFPYTSPSGLVTITGASLAGFYYFFYNWQVGSECASATRTAIQVNVTPPGTASFPAATATSCGTSPYTLGGTVGGAATTGTYTSSGTGTFSPNATTLGATYTPSAADITAGTVTITLTTPASGPCPAGTATLTLSLSPAPVATFTYPTTAICAGQTATVAPTLGTGATAGTFTSTTGLTISAAGVINPATSTAGTYTVTNTIAASGNCPSATATASVTIAPATTATFSYAGSPFCRTATTAVAPTVTGTAGGTFSSTTGLTINATTGAITPSTSTAGSYVVTYTVAGTCGSSATQTVVITTAPVAAFTYPTTAICAGQTAPVSPTPGPGATAGTFTSTAGLTISAAGVINPATSTAGTYTVTNTVAAAGGCAAVTSTQSVTILPLAGASFNYGAASSTFCVSGTTNPTVTLGTGATAGAFTVAPATGLTLNATTGAITLSSSTPGTYTVTNTVAASGAACGSTATSTVTITAAPVAAFTYPNASICAGQTATVSPTLGTGATAGTYSSTTGLTISAAGVIDPATSVAGTYTVTNTVAAANGCAAVTSTLQVTILARPAAPTLTVVYNGTNTTLTSSAATGNQFFLNGTAVAGATGTTYTVTGQPAQFGAYTVTTTNAQGCVSLPSAAITITTARNALADATLRAFPNPTTSGALTLELTGYPRAATLTVLNALGQVVSTAELPAGSAAPRTLPVLLPAASGVYLLQVRAADGLRTVRVTRP